MEEPVVRSRLPRRERRAQLLEAASQVFAAKGYHAAAMDDIAEAGGVSKPVLYQHFDSKLELYLGLFDVHSERIVNVVLQALRGTTENEDRVAATFEAFYGFVESNDPGFRFVFESDLTGDPRVAERSTRLHQELASAVAALIVDQTGMSLPDATLAASSLVGMAESSARAWRATDLDRQRAQQVMSTLAWRGISGFPVQEGK
ncbi:MAG: TetR/AcrR family transcriptional regulator [Propionibacterium sp.]|nr:TetR/AcrR family transcriptional regulator [Propionibacterium sp.]